MITAPAMFSCLSWNGRMLSLKAARSSVVRACVPDEAAAGEATDFAGIVGDKGFSVVCFWPYNGLAQLVKATARKQRTDTRTEVLLLICYLHFIYLASSLVCPEKLLLATESDFLTPTLHGSFCGFHSHAGSWRCLTLNIGFVLVCCMLCVPLVAGHGKLLHPVAHNGIAKAGSLGHSDRPLRRYFDAWFYDVFVPITQARGDIARQREPRECRHRNVVGPANAGFKHASTPNGDFALAARFLHPSRFGVAADTT